MPDEWLVEIGWGVRPVVVLRKLWMEGKCSDRPFPASDRLCGFPGTVFYQKVATGEFFCRCNTHALEKNLLAPLYKEITRDEFEVARIMET